MYGMLGYAYTAAKIVLNKGIVLLSSVFFSAFPGVTYTEADQHILQIPPISIHI